jgi:hypothetical protein
MSLESPMDAAEATDALVERVFTSAHCLISPGSTSATAWGVTAPLTRMARRPLGLIGAGPRTSASGSSSKP